MRQCNIPILVQMMAWHQIGAMSSSEPTLPCCQLYPKAHISVIIFLQKKYTWKCRLRNGGHFVSGSMCWWGWPGYTRLTDVILCLAIIRRKLHREILTMGNILAPQRSIEIIVVYSGIRCQPIHSWITNANTLLLDLQEIIVNIPSRFWVDIVSVLHIT